MCYFLALSSTITGKKRCHLPKGLADVVILRVSDADCSPITWPGPSSKCHHSIISCSSSCIPSLISILLLAFGNFRTSLREDSCQILALYLQKHLPPGNYFLGQPLGHVITDWTWGSGGRGLLHSCKHDCEHLNFHRLPVSLAPCGESWGLVGLDSAPALLTITISSQFVNEVCRSPLMDRPPNPKDKNVLSEKKSCVISFRLYLHTE